MNRSPEFHHKRNGIFYPNWWGLTEALVEVLDGRIGVQDQNGFSWVFVTNMDDLPDLLAILRLESDHILGQDIIAAPAADFQVDSMQEVRLRV